MSHQYKLDMTMMLAVHDALRREMERLARVTATVEDDPRQILSTAAGWELFKIFLHAHHRAEDEKIWPVMQAALAARPDDLALLEAMEAEHAIIDPLLLDIDAALADREAGLERLHGLVDALHSGLTGHLKHEEAEALQLMDTTMSEEQWDAFGERQRDRIGDNAQRYMPWILDEMEASRAEFILSRLPGPLRAAFENDWRPTYQALNLWGGKDGVTASA
ncbi:hemerythrin domain-containing protein [Streptomyces sp. Je 1-79]|uniref:hemerythrin domain-containing protein n=1 Tax=Streptomyces sp. Je 1-79 TaxID=2943847 RepID=UPI0021A41E4A|nr:hemerythrin domain-containing protein [Streptomyces sp. Je 1-79]MCT4356195.1 hemerythrin domain-containing protein [Streptomyces sp. Je 1-79]